MSIEDQLARWARAQRGNPPLHPDVERVTAAWRSCGVHTRELILMHYIWRAPAPVVCRRLRIPWRPRRWRDELAKAHAELAQHLQMRP